MWVSISNELKHPGDVPTVQCHARTLLPKTNKKKNVGISLITHKLQCKGEEESLTGEYFSWGFHS